MISKYISRWAAFVASWLAALIAGFVVLKAKTWFGLDLNTVEVTGLLLGVLLPLGGAVTAWVHNRGKYEIALLEKSAGLDPALVDKVAEQVVKKLPPVPTAPQAPTSPMVGGAPAAPQAPPEGSAPGGTSSGQ